MCQWIDLRMVYECFVIQLSIIDTFVDDNHDDNDILRPETSDSKCIITNI